MTTPSRSIRSKRRGRSKSETLYTFYQIQITGWEFGWSFSLVPSQDEWKKAGYFDEFSTLTLKGRVCMPEHFKYPEVTLNLMSDYELRQSASRPNGIGSMSASEGQLRGFICIPSTGIVSLISIVTSLTYIEIIGTPLRYRKGLISSISIGTILE